MTDQESSTKNPPDGPDASNRIAELTSEAIESSVDLLRTDKGVWTRVAKDIGTILAITLVVLSVGLGIKFYLFPDADDFLVSASAIPIPAPTDASGASGPSAAAMPSGKYWRVSGVVTDDGELAEGSYVLVTLEDEKGNRFAKEHDAADGKFEVVIIQYFDTELAEAPKAKLVKIYARQIGIGGVLFSETTTTLYMAANARATWKDASTRPFIFVLGLFIYTALVTIVRLREGFWNLLKYYVLISLDLLFTVSMIYLIGITITSLEPADGEEPKSTSLGFGYVFYDSYVSDGPKDWNFSLTAPHENAGPGSTTTAAADSGPARGFGAPLWVLLLSVLGAGLYTIKLVVDNVRKGSTYTEKAVRTMAADIIQHQFYILFAPLGSIFVYQFLILAGIGSKPLTVALAALASGIALNVLLKKAWDSVTEILQTDQTSTDGTNPVANTTASPAAFPTSPEPTAEPPAPEKTPSS